MSVEVMLRRLRPAKGAGVLDLGCGNGNLVRELRDEGLDAYGCDFADTPGSDFSSQVTSPYLRPFPSGPYRIPFEDCRFDYVISSQVLEHVRDNREPSPRFGVFSRRAVSDCMSSRAATPRSNRMLGYRSRRSFNRRLGSISGRC